MIFIVCEARYNLFVCTCQTEGFEAELGAIQDDKAMSLVQTCSRVLQIALKVPRLLSRSDLLDLSNVNWTQRHKNRPVTCCNLMNKVKTC